MKILKVLSVSLTIFALALLSACDKQGDSGKQPVYERGTDGVLYRIEKTCDNGKCTFKRVPVPEEVKK